MASLKVARNQHTTQHEKRKHGGTYLQRELQVTWVQVQCTQAIYIDARDQEAHGWVPLFHGLLYIGFLSTCSRAGFLTITLLVVKEEDWVQLTFLSWLWFLLENQLPSDLTSNIYKVCPSSLRDSEQSNFLKFYLVDLLCPKNFYYSLRILYQEGPCLFICLFQEHRHVEEHTIWGILFFTEKF